MKNLKNLLLVLCAIPSFSFSAPVESADIRAEQLNQFLNVRDGANYTYSTKFGDLKFLRDDGSLGEPAKTITLNGKLLISTMNEIDGQGNSVSLMSEMMTNTSIQRVRLGSSKTKKFETKRMIILVGPDLNCVKNFIILDFTGEKPFFSKKFAENPNDRHCLTFKKAKWGKKESEIVLDGPENYIYYTNDKVIGPFVYE